MGVLLYFPCLFELYGVGLGLAKFGDVVVAAGLGGLLGRTATFPLVSRWLFFLLSRLGFCGPGLIFGAVTVCKVHLLNLQF